MTSSCKAKARAVLGVCPLPVVRSEHVGTLFDNTQYQESLRPMRIETHLDNALFLVTAESPAGS